jgi:glycolate oxidase FAD binding subunit
MSSTHGGLAAGISDLRDALLGGAASGQRWLPRGRGTKDALSTAAGDVSSLDVSSFSGIVEYAPSEFTVTALAGTPVAEVRAALAEHGQYLPFDPILVDAGATVGGTLAAGVSGSGRVRYGGIRDFVLGVRFLDGEGILVRGGGKVVKNAAGFDLPKLMVGSLGGLGVLIEVTLKVFPAAEATATGCVELGGLDAAVAALRRLLAGPTEVDALELEPPGRLWLRIAGRRQALAPRLERALRIAAGAPGANASREEERESSPPRSAAARSVDDGEAEAHWRSMRELTWVPAGWTLVKVPLQPGRIAALDGALGRAGEAGSIAGVGGGAGDLPAQGSPPRAVYAAGGQQAWVAWPGARPVEELDRTLEGLGLCGLVVRGEAGRRRLGRRPAEAALDRARLALDPHGRFRAP